MAATAAEESASSLEDPRVEVLRAVEGVASTGQSTATAWHVDAFKQGTSPNTAEVKELFASAVGTTPLGSSGAGAPEAGAAAAAAVSRLSFRTPDCVLATAEVPRLFVLRLTDRALGPTPLILQVAPRVFLPLEIEHRGEPVSTPIIRTLCRAQCSCAACPCSRSLRRTVPTTRTRRPLRSKRCRAEQKYFLSLFLL
jgi:hypothetical protein